MGHKSGASGPPSRVIIIPELRAARLICSRFFIYNPEIGANSFERRWNGKTLQINYPLNGGQRAATGTGGRLSSECSIIHFVWNAPRLKLEIALWIVRFLNMCRTARKGLLAGEISSAFWIDGCRMKICALLFSRVGCQVWVISEVILLFVDVLKIWYCCCRVWEALMIKFPKTYCVCMKIYCLSLKLSLRTRDVMY